MKRSTVASFPPNSTTHNSVIGNSTTQNNATENTTGEAEPDKETPRASYLGTWDSLEVNSLNVEVNLVISKDTVTINMNEGEDNSGTSGSFNYTVTQDSTYTYLEIVNPDDSAEYAVVVQISQDTLVWCSPAEDRDNNVGVTPSGKTFNGEGAFMVRQGSSTTTLPTSWNWSDDTMDRLSEIQYEYYPDCSILVLYEENGETNFYVASNGDIEYIEGASVAHLREHQKDIILTDYNYVITDNK